MEERIKEELSKIISSSLCEASVLEATRQYIALTRTHPQLSAELTGGHCYYTDYAVGDVVLAVSSDWGTPTPFGHKDMTAVEVAKIMSIRITKDGVYYHLDDSRDSIGWAADCLAPASKLKDVQPMLERRSAESVAEKMEELSKSIEMYQKD